MCDRRRLLNLVDRVGQAVNADDTPGLRIRDRAVTIVWHEGFGLL